jgi:hypothetical protein
MSDSNDTSNNNDLKNAAKLMHHTSEMQKIVYNSQSIANLHLNSLDTAALNDAVRAMHHTRQMQEEVYNL